MPDDRKHTLRPVRKKARRLQGVRSPSSVEVAYRAALLTFVREIQKDIEEQILPIFEDGKPLADSAGNILVVDSVSSVLSIYTQQMEGLRDKYDGMRDRYKRMAARFGKDMDSVTRKSWYNMLTRTMGAQTDLVAIVGERGVHHALFAETHSNVNLIRTIPSRYFDKVHELVTQNFIHGSNNPKGLMAELMPLLRKDIRMVATKAKKRARLIARDQTSKINSALVKIRQTNLGIEEYIWRNSQDPRVRGNPTGWYPNVPRDKNHWIREGKIFRWDKPPADGHPGEAINCRCFAEPIIKLDGIETEDLEEHLR